MTDTGNIHTENNLSHDSFIMLPTMDVCFKGLMHNPKVRKGFVAALLDISPGAVRHTVLLPAAGASRR